MESIEDLIRKADNFGLSGDQKPTFDDLEDEKDSDDDEMPGLA